MSVNHVIIPDNGWALDDPPSFLKRLFSKQGCDHHYVHHDNLHNDQKHWWDHKTIPIIRTVGVAAAFLTSK